MRRSRRLFVTLSLALVLLLVMEEFADAGLPFAMWAWVAWLGRGLWELLLRSLGWFSRAAQAWADRVLRRTMLRRLWRPLWQMITVVVVAVLSYHYGKRTVYRSLVRVRRQQRRAGQWFMELWNYEPDLPRSVRAMVAIFVIGLCILAFLYINDRFGETKGLIFSIAASWVVEKVPAFGVDSLLGLITERWQPVRIRTMRFRRNWPRTYWAVSWLWLGPLLTWFKNILANLLRRATRRRKT